MKPEGDIYKCLIAVSGQSVGFWGENKWLVWQELIVFDVYSLEEISMCSVDAAGMKMWGFESAGPITYDIFVCCTMSVV